MVKKICLILIVLSLSFFNNVYAANPTDSTNKVEVQQKGTENFVFSALGALGWVVGLVSGTMQIVSVIKERKKRKSVEESFEKYFNDLQLEGKYTQRDIDKLSKTFDNLKKQINSEIPKLAKKMFIENQRGEIKKYITDSYTKYKQLSYELGNSEIDRDLDDIIKGAIEEKVNSYSSKEEKESLIFRFVFVILCLTVISFFWPSIYHTLYWYDPFRYIIRIFSPISVMVYGLLLVVILFFVKRFKFTRIRILILNKKEIFRIILFFVNVIWIALLVLAYFDITSYSYLYGFSSLLAFLFGRIISLNLKQNGILL